MYLCVNYRHEQYSNTQSKTNYLPAIRIRGILQWNSSQVLQPILGIFNWFSFALAIVLSISSKTGAMLEFLLSCPKLPGILAKWRDTLDCFDHKRPWTCLIITVITEWYQNVHTSLIGLFSYLSYVLVPVLIPWTNSCVHYNMHVLRGIKQKTV